MLTKLTLSLGDNPGADCKRDALQQSMNDDRHGAGTLKAVQRGIIQPGLAHTRSEAHTA